MTSHGPSRRHVSHWRIHLTFQHLLCAVLWVGSAGALAQANGAGQSTGTSELIRQQGLQKQRLNLGLAATQLSQKDAKRLQVQGHASAPRQPVSEADVLKTREERIRRLNASKVNRPATP